MVRVESIRLGIFPENQACSDADPQMASTSTFLSCVLSNGHGFHLRYRWFRRASYSPDSTRVSLPPPTRVFVFLSDANPLIESLSWINTTLYY